MKNLHNLESYRDIQAENKVYGVRGDHENGGFVVPSVIDKKPLYVIASAGEGWDHVSVSRRGRTPNWDEMCQIKALFFKDDETAIQYHPAAEVYVNYHPHCLHLWRPQNQEVPCPPTWMVGPKGAR